MIKSHDIVSNEAKKKQAVRDERNELCTHSTTLKFVNAVNKLPRKLSLNYYTDAKSIEA